jgi:hypothetical protein
MSKSDIGYIYVVQMEGTRYFKIGRSNNVPRRMSEIGVQLPSPYRLRFAHKVCRVRFIESDLHQDFRSYRRNGEWFELPEDGVSLIKARLLCLQAEELTVRLLNRLLDSPFSSESLIRFGSVISRMGYRFERRLTLKHNLSVALLAVDLQAKEADDVLSAEVVL